MCEIYNILRSTVYDSQSLGTFIVVMIQSMLFHSNLVIIILVIAILVMFFASQNSRSSSDFSSHDQLGPVQG